jgi:hypothetical protein
MIPDKIIGSEGFAHKARFLSGQEPQRVAEFRVFKPNFGPESETFPYLEDMEPKPRCNLDRSSENLSRQK